MLPLLLLLAALAVSFGSDATTTSSSSSGSSSGGSGSAGGSGSSTTPTSSSCECAALLEGVASLVLELRSPCVLRGVLSRQNASAAAKAVRKTFKNAPGTPVRGGSGADVASFDGGGGEQRAQGDLVEQVTSDADGSFVAFDSSAAAASALDAVQAAIGWSPALRTLHSHHVSAAAAAKESGDGWPILSVGAFPGGLAPHVHGRSYLLLLQGTKIWKMWPPEQGLPEEARLALPPPLLRANASAVMRSLLSLPRSSSARPMVCKQRAGDVMLLPAGTHHATLNAAPKTPAAGAAAAQDAGGRRRAGLTIGVGGQAAWSLDDRLQLADLLLESSGGESIAAHAIAGNALAARIDHTTPAEAVEVATWHLRNVLRAEPADARAAVALAGLLSRTEETTAAGGGSSKGSVEVIQQAVAALAALVGANEKREDDEPLAAAAAVSAADASSVAAGLRRLGGYLVQHGEREKGAAALKQAFSLDPAAMRSGATSLAADAAAAAVEERRGHGGEL